MVSKNRPGALLARIEQAILEAPNIAQEHKDYLETFVWVTNAFANNGSILVMLDDALERGDWAAINRAFSSLQTTQERDSLNIGSLRSMQDAWRDKFAGNAHLSLLGVLDHMEENFLDETYAKLVPVVQSSGVGKSRLMDEISRMRLGICYTFRLQGQTGFPPGDREIADFVLSSVLPNTSEHSCIVALLSATVEQSESPGIIGKVLC